MSLEPGQVWSADRPPFVFALVTRQANSNIWKVLVLSAREGPAYAKVGTFHWLEFENTRGFTRLL